MHYCVLLSRILVTTSCNLTEEIPNCKTYNIFFKSQFSIILSILGLPLCIFHHICNDIVSHILAYAFQMVRLNLLQFHICNYSSVFVDPILFSYQPLSIFSSLCTVVNFEYSDTCLLLKMFGHINTHPAELNSDSH